jgi:DNA-binding IclR family transcriptional regulator
VARPAPAVDRTVAVLNHLATHPTRQFTLSELARELELNKATAHGMLATLTDAGYVTRDPEAKTYGLGPALIALGNAALTSTPAARLAQPHMALLSREFDLECVASAAIADEIVILARAGTPRPLGINVEPGQRLPLAPPLGTVFVAWSDAEAIDRWLSHVGPEQSEADSERYRQALATVRERGYSVALGGEGQQRLVQALQDAGHEPKGARGGEEYALVELAGDSRYRINHIGAPVFGPRGEVALAMFLIGFRGQIAAEEVPRYADRLLEAADTVTMALHGRHPAAIA